MTLTTVKEYCALRGVSRQFVNDYVKKGKFQLVELPTFVNFDGGVVEIGKQKFLQVPEQYAIGIKPYWSGELSFEEYNTQLAKDTTDDLEIQRHIKHCLTIEPEFKGEYKKKLREVLFPINHPKRELLDAALTKLGQLLIAELADLDMKVRKLQHKQIV